MKTAIEQEKAVKKKYAVESRIKEAQEYTVQINETFRKSLPKNVKAGFLIDPKSQLLPTTALAAIARAVALMGSYSSTSTYSGNKTTVITTDNTEAPFSISKEGLSFSVMDPSHVALTQGTIPAKAFASFYYEAPEPTSFCVRAVGLLNVTKPLEPDQSVSGRLQGDKLYLDVTGGSYTKHNKLTLIESWAKSAPLPKIELLAKLTLERASFLKLLAEATKAKEDCFTIDTNKDSVTFRFWGSDFEKSDVTWGRGKEVPDILVTAPQKSTYSIPFIVEMLKAVKTETLTFEFSTKKPCKLTFPVDTLVDVSFWLAPRAQDIPDEPKTMEEAYPSKIAAREPDESPTPDAESKPKQPAPAEPPHKKAQ